MIRFICILITLYMQVSMYNVNATTYGVEQKRQSSGRDTVRIYEQKSGLTLWNHTFSRIHSMKWSSNKKVLAIVGEKHPSKDRYFFRLTIWRAGKGMRTFRYIEPFRKLETVRNIEWSKDGNLLLILGPVLQGDGIQGYNSLWCVRTKDGKSKQISENKVFRAKWASSNMIHYWTFSGKYYKDPKSGIVKRTEVLHKHICKY